MSDSIHTWDRFVILYCAEGREMRECYNILDEEGFPVPKWTSFRSKFYKNPQWKIWEAAHIESRNLCLAIRDVQDSVTQIAMGGLLRYRYQLSQKKNISIEEVKELIKLAGDVLALTPHHPKYNTRQNVSVLHGEVGIAWHPAVQILYKSMLKVPAFKQLLEDPIINREFVKELEKTTREVKKGEEILEKSPGLIQRKSGNEKE